MVAIRAMASILEWVLSELPENMSADALSECLLSYAKGRLDPKVRQAVEAAAAADPAIAEELAFYRSLARAAPAGPPAGAADALGWARLDRAIDAEQASTAPARPKSANDNPAPWRRATLALSVLALVQAGFLLSPLILDPSRHGPAIYVPVADEADDGPRVKVAFVPSATEADIRALLTTVGGRIVDGPSSLGLYDIRFTTPAQRAAGLERLGRQSDVVESVVAQ